VAELFPLSPPPQSLETLDSWGALDSLPAPLDSPLWQSAGLYGLRIEDGARSSSGFSARTAASLEGRLCARSGGALRRTVEIALGSPACAGGALRLSFGLTLAPLGRAQAGARLELAEKGWNWGGNAPQDPQDWTPHTSAGASWRELEQQRSSAWR